MWHTKWSTFRLWPTAVYTCNGKEQNISRKLAVFAHLTTFLQ